MPPPSPFLCGSTVHGEPSSPIFLRSLYLVLPHLSAPNWTGIIRRSTTHNDDNIRHTFSGSWTNDLSSQETKRPRQRSLCDGQLSSLSILISCKLLLKPTADITVWRQLPKYSLVSITFFAGIGRHNARTQTSRLGRLSMAGRDWRLRTAASTSLHPQVIRDVDHGWWYWLGLTPNLSTRALWQPPVLCDGPVSRDISGTHQYSLVSCHPRRLWREFQVGEENENLVYSSPWDFKSSLTGCKILRHGTSIFTSLPKGMCVADFYRP
jgi:hypothetical protein